MLPTFSNFIGYFISVSTLSSSFSLLVSVPIAVSNLIFLLSAFGDLRQHSSAALGVSLTRQFNNFAVLPRLCLQDFLTKEEERGRAYSSAVSRSCASILKTGASRLLSFTRSAFTFVACRMKILCVICHDLLLLPSEDIFFTHCGHVFHHRCLLQWLERSNTCPQCRDQTTEDRIHRAHFTFSNTEIAAHSNADNLSLQGRIDSLKFQILLNENNIKHYTSNNAKLQKQNAGLRQEVRKVESEINQKNSAIYALKEQIKYFKEKYMEYKVLKKKLSQKEREVEEFQDMCKTLSTGTLEDVQEMIGKMTDRNNLINCISIMKQIILKKTKKVESLRNRLTTHSDSLAEERSKKLEFEERLAFCESENLSLRHRVNELEKSLEITSDQNSVTESNSRENCNKNSLISVQTVDVLVQQTNTNQKTADQNVPSSPEVEIIADTNQEKSMDNSTSDECPTVTKKARICL